MKHVHQKTEVNIGAEEEVGMVAAEEEVEAGAEVEAEADEAEVVTVEDIR